MAALSLASLYDTLRTLERVIGAFPVLILATDRAGRIVMSTERTRDALGRAEVDMLDHPIAEVVPGLALKIGDRAEDEPPAVDIGATHRRALRRDGTAFPVQVQASAHRLGEDMICVFALLDMTDRLQADRAYRESQALLDAVLSGLPAMVSAKNPDGTYEFVNAYQADVFGIAPEDAVGKTAADLLGGDTGRQIDGADRRIANGTAISQSGSEELIDAEGRPRTFMTTRAAMRDPKGHIQRVLSVGLDITHATAAEERLERLSLLDDQTGLPNRGALHQILNAQIRGAKRDNRRIGVILLSVTNLSEIADDLGDMMRDGALRRLAIRLGGLLPESSVLSRFDDTTFGLVVANPEDDVALEREAARLVARAGRPIETAEAAVTVKCRAGLALYPETGLEAEALLRAAEHSLRVRAKGPVVPVPKGNRDLDAYMEARRETAKGLRRDLEHDRLDLRLRPVRALGDDRLSGFEACLYDSTGRALLPADSVTDPAAASAVASLGSELCERLLRDACHVVADWRTGAGVTVPLAGDLLHQPDLVDMVEDAVRRSGIAADRLLLAVDETALAPDPEAVDDTLHDLAALGIGLVLTGFGAGGNPMLALSAQPFGHLVVALSTVGPLDETVAATIAFGRALGRTVGATGVNTADELAFLRGCGCTDVSGPVVGVPLSPTEARALVGAAGEAHARRA